MLVPIGESDNWLDLWLVYLRRWGTKNSTGFIIYTPHILWCPVPARGIIALNTLSQDRFLCNKDLHPSHFQIDSFTFPAGFPRVSEIDIGANEVIATGAGQHCTNVTALAGRE